MRAWRVEQFGEPADVLVLRDDVPETDPGPDQLKIEVEVAGLGLPDALMCRNNYPLVPPLPFTPSQEATGRVISVGENVDPALVGQRVMGPTLFQQGHGGLAERPEYQWRQDRLGQSHRLLAGDRRSERG